MISETLSQTPHVNGLLSAQVGSCSWVFQARMRTHSAEAVDLGERFMKMLDTSTLIAKMAQAQLECAADESQARWSHHHCGRLGSRSQDNCQAAGGLRLFAVVDSFRREANRHDHLAGL